MKWILLVTPYGVLKYAFIPIAYHDVSTFDKVLY
jgi:hypothetical protein